MFFYEILNTPLPLAGRKFLFENYKPEQEKREYTVHATWKRKTTEHLMGKREKTVHVMWKRENTVHAMWKRENTVHVMWKRENTVHLIKRKFVNNVVYTIIIETILDFADIIDLQGRWL